MILTFILCSFTVTAINIGEVPPDFTLKDERGRNIKFSTLLGSGPIVIFFYSKDTSKACQKELSSFNSYMKRFASKKASVFGVSTDSVTMHSSTVKSLKLKYSLLSDSKKLLQRLWEVSKNKLSFQSRITYVFDSSGKLISFYKNDLSPTAHAKFAYKIVKKLNMSSVNLLSSKIERHIYSKKEQEELDLLMNDEDEDSISLDEEEQELYPPLLDQINDDFQVSATDGSAFIEMLSSLEQV